MVKGCLALIAGLTMLGPVPSISQTPGKLSAVTRDLAGQSSTVSVNPQLPIIPERKFACTDFGALGDGKTLNTEALRKTIAACEDAGGGQVIIPPGIFVTGPIELASNMALVLAKGATVRGSEAFKDYNRPAAGAAIRPSTLPLIGGANLTDVEIRGEGTIDGAGEGWWKRFRAERAAGVPAQGQPRAPGQPVETPRPKLVLLTGCKRVHIQGVTLKNSPQFHLVPQRCQDVLIEDVSISAPADSPNTDAIDPTSSRNVLIRRCFVDVGDDNVSFKSNPKDEPTQDVLVTDCTFKHGHGASVGSNIGGGIRNITVQRCSFENTDNGIRIKSARDRGGLVENIVYRDITMKHVGVAITINLFYFDKAGQKERALKPVTGTTPIVRNLQIVNVTVDAAGTAGEIVGLPEKPVTDVLLDNVRIKAQSGMTIQDAGSVELRDVEIVPQKGEPLTVTHSDVKRTKGKISELQHLFEQPPDDSRIMMRWWWFGPAVTKPELEREMRMMKAGGIGGFEVQPVYPLALDDSASGIRNLPFLSDEFIEALGFAAEKARELGLRMDLTLGSGWPYGGPQVPIGEAAGKLRCVQTKVAVNSSRIAVPDLGAGEKLLAVFLAQTNGQSIVTGSMREITDIRDKTVRLPQDLQESAEVLFFISSRTGMQVKRAAVGAEGFVLNHYDRVAVQHYLTNVGDRLMQAFGDHPPYSIFCDSLEVYASDWTDDLLEEFRNRRGYDLKPYLPALVADVGPKTAAVRHDWGKTLTELFNERFVVPVREWAGRHHTLFRMQGYGIPPASISSNALADLPEGEGAQWKILCASRWASSASHLYGRQVTSSETWTWLHSPVFRATPLDIKAEADLHFLQGINQLVGHGWPYTPEGVEGVKGVEGIEGVEYPGWRFYAAGAFNEKNPWWIVMPDVALYLQRISFLLRQGQPANDVALYLPNSDAWASFQTAHVNMIETLRGLIGPDIVTRILEAGYDLDFFDDDALKQVGRVQNGALALGQNKYKIVILPGVKHIPLDTLRRLEEFARSGGILIATRHIPDAAPGLRAVETEQTQIRELSHHLFEGPSAPAHLVLDENQLGARLNELLPPDVSRSPSTPDIGFIHRRANDAEIYFLANTSNKPQSLNATFRVGRLQAEWWDPFTGKVSSAEAVAVPEGANVSIELEPYGSRVLVFSERALPEPVSPRASVTQAVMDISANWKVSFGPGGPSINMDYPRSWTDDDRTRYFSGLATYEKDVVAPAGMLKEGLTVRLDFGKGVPDPPRSLRSGMQAWLEPPVAEAAVVYINDRRAGSIWCPPYSVDVTGLLRNGENKIRIIVGNLAINHMAGHALPDYHRLNLRYGERFQPQDMDKVQPVLAGLLGPIRLIATGGSQKPAARILQQSTQPNQWYISGDIDGH